MVLYRKNILIDIMWKIIYNKKGHPYTINSKKGGHDMPEKTTLYETLKNRRLEAKNASDEKIAGDIWQVVQDAFDVLDCYRLELIDYMTVSLTEAVDHVSVGVTIKESYETSDETIDVGEIVMSAEKLERLMDIMPIVMKLAEEAGCTRVWTDTIDGDRIWGFHIEFNEDL